MRSQQEEGVTGRAVMAEDTGISSDDDIDLDLLDEEELEHRRELAAVISNMKTQLSNYAAEKREQDIKGLESLVRDVLDDVEAGEEMKRLRTESLPTRDGSHPQPSSSSAGAAGGSSSGAGGRAAETRNAVSNLLGETDGEDLTDHEHEEDSSCYENRSGLAEDMKFLASMPELCGQSCLPSLSLAPLGIHASAALACLPAPRLPASDHSGYLSPLSCRRPSTSFSSCSPTAEAGREARHVSSERERDHWQDWCIRIRLPAASLSLSPPTSMTHVVT